MTTHVEAEDLPAYGATLHRPYAPSWVDRLTDRLERLPGPAWGIYLLAAFGLNLLNASLEWIAGSYPVGTFYPLHLVTATSIIAYLALIHYLDSAAARALVKFRPVLDREEQDIDELRYRLTTMPARPVRRLTLAGLLYAVLITYLVEREWILRGVVAFESPVTSWLDWAVIVATNLMLLIFVYHTIHQLRIINHVYITHTRIDLFHLTPLYAFAGLAARTALGWLAITYLWLAAMPTGASDIVMLFYVAMLNLLGTVAFIWPLVGIHRLLEEEKARYQLAIRRRMQSAMAELHRRTDANRFDETAPVIQLLGGLKEELELIDRIPTWPWQPELFRTVVTALVLPILLWFVNRALEHFVRF